MSKVVVVIGAGSIGVAIARRVGAGKRILLADLRKDNADAAATVLADAGFEATTAAVDVSSRESVLDGRTVRAIVGALSQYRVASSVGQLDVTRSCRPWSISRCTFFMYWPNASGVIRIDSSARWTASRAASDRRAHRLSSC